MFRTHPTREHERAWQDVQKIRFYLGNILMLFPATQGLVQLYKGDSMFQRVHNVHYMKTVEYN